MTMADKEENDLSDIKKLFVLLLLDRGFSQSQLAKVLGTSQAGISRMFPGGVPSRKDS
jgi:predicted transcriptional regulator